MRRGLAGLHKAPGRGAPARFCSLRQSLRVALHPLLRGTKSSRPCGGEAKLRRIRFHRTLAGGTATCRDGRVVELLDSWPNNFLHWMRQSHTTYCGIVQPREVPPFWLEDAVCQLKRHQHPARSQAEIHEVARFVVSRHGRLEVGMLRRCYGVNLGPERYPLTFRTAVSHENHEALIASLEHAAAGSFDARIRFACLQDIVMFSLYRFTDLSTAKLCALPLAVMTPLQILPSDEAWWGAPSNSVEAIRAVSRHLDGVRRRFSGLESCPFTFLSPFTGRPLRATGMQSRFRQAVVRAGLAAPIPNMTVYKARQSESFAGSKLQY